MLFAHSVMSAAERFVTVSVSDVWRHLLFVQNAKVPKPNTSKLPPGANNPGSSGRPHRWLRGGRKFAKGFGLVSGALHGGERDGRHLVMASDARDARLADGTLHVSSERKLQPGEEDALVLVRDRGWRNQCV